MKFNIQKETGVTGCNETVLRLTDGRFLCRCKETYGEIESYIKFILSHPSNFWDDITDESSLQKSIINDDERSIVGPEDLSHEDIATLRKAGGKVKIEPDFDGLLDLTYNDSYVEKYSNRFYVDAGNALEMKCFDNSGILFQVSTYHISDIFNFKQFVDEDILFKARDMEIHLDKEIKDKLISLGVDSQYNERFGEIKIKKENSNYPIIKYNDHYYECLSEIHFAHTADDDESVLTAKIFKIYRILFEEETCNISNECLQPTLSEYINSIKLGAESFRTLKNLQPVLSKEGKLIVNRFGDTVDFKMKDIKTNQLYALKAFTKDITRLTNKYRAIEAYFNDNDYFDYICCPHLYENELSIETNSVKVSIPVVLTDWPKANTLAYYVKSQKENSVVINMLTYNLSILFNRLRHSDFAHGNLNSRNIYLDTNSGTFMLTDYDNMILPDYDDGIIKDGDKNYIYPGTTTYNSKNGDDFAISVILTSLKVISIKSDLCNTDGTNSSLLFGEKDFRNIANSSLTPYLGELMEDSEFRNAYSIFANVLNKGYLEESIKWNLSFSNKYESESSHLYEQAVSMIDILQYEEAAKLLQKAGMMGNVKANRLLAKLTYNSLIKSVPKLRPLLAVWYYKRNLIYNDNVSAFNLGVIYNSFRNYKEAARFFTKSAMLGNAIAMCNLAYAYEHGIGVERDPAMEEQLMLCASECENGIARDIVLNSVFGLEPYYEIIDTYVDRSKGFY